MSVYQHVGNCAVCGAVFYITTSFWIAPVFCSRRCRADNQVLGIVAQTPRQTTEEWVDGRPCHYCDGPANSRDHIVPRAAGGTRDPRNLVPACRRCNELKSDLWTTCRCAFCDQAMILFGPPGYWEAEDARLAKRAQEAAERAVKATLRFPTDLASRLTPDQAERLSALAEVSLDT